MDEMEKFIRATYRDLESVDLWLPHAASAYMCRLADERLNLHGKVFFDVFPTYGNLASASIPTAIRMAEEMNRLKRGNRIVLCPASAGMSLALVDLVY
jgi:3-oxoacyl-[acyl-carrier-protein] synthase III